MISWLPARRFAASKPQHARRHRPAIATPRAALTLAGNWNSPCAQAVKDACGGKSVGSSSDCRLEMTQCASCFAAQMTVDLPHVIAMPRQELLKLEALRAR